MNKSAEAKYVFRCTSHEHPVGVWIGPQELIVGMPSDKVEGRLMSFLRRKAEMNSAKLNAASGKAAEWGAQFPALWEYLTSDKYPDGGKRQTSTLLLFVDGGEFKAALRDRDTGHTLWVTSATIEDALIDLEASLTSESPQWRKSEYGGGAKKGAK